MVVWSLSTAFNRALTTLMLGYKTAEKLHVMDKIQASDEAIEHLDDILFHRIPYVSDYI